MKEKTENKAIEKPVKKELSIGKKFAISIAFDVLDFTIGRIPVFGTLFDMGGTILSIWLWGWVGSTQGLEIPDFTDFFDGFVPSVTIAGLLKLTINKIKKDKEEEK